LYAAKRYSVVNRKASGSERRERSRDCLAIGVGIKDGGLGDAELQDRLAAGPAGHAITGCAVQVTMEMATDANLGAVEGVTAAAMADCSAQQVRR